jgi:hypothetical protein
VQRADLSGWRAAEAVRTVELLWSTAVACALWDFRACLVPVRCAQLPERLLAVFWMSGRLAHGVGIVKSLEVETLACQSVLLPR